MPDIRWLSGLLCRKTPVPLGNDDQENHHSTEEEDNFINDVPNLPGYEDDNADGPERMRDDSDNMPITDTQETGAFCV